MKLKSKKGATATSVLLIVVLTLILCGFALFTFITSKKPDKNILLSRAIENIYFKEEEIKFIIKRIAEISLKESGWDKQKFEAKFKKEVNKLNLEDLTIAELKDKVNKNDFKIDLTEKKLTIKFDNFKIAGGANLIKDQIHWEWLIPLGVTPEIKQSLTILYKTELIIEVERLIATKPTTETKTNIIFIPVNWYSTQEQFDKTVDSQYSYFLSLLSEEKKKEFDKKAYFDKMDLKLTECKPESKVEIEEKIKNNFPAYDKERDFVVIVVSEIGVEDINEYTLKPVPSKFIRTIGHCFGKDKVVVDPTDARTLAHELGHVIFKMCDESRYLVVICEENKGFEPDFRKQILANPDDYFIPLKDLANEKINNQQFIEKISESKKFSQEFINRLFECGPYKGWLLQNYLGVFSDGPCPNSYPDCCADSPKYTGDNNPYGRNCINLDYGLCVGMPCGENCRSIMGGLHLRSSFILRYPTQIERKV